MSFNLSDTIKGLFNNEIINKTVAHLGESESGISRAISGITPTVLGALLEKSSTAEGAQTVSQLAGEQNRSGILQNPGNIMGGSNDAVSTENGLPDSLFGNKLNGLKNLIANFAGIKASSVSSLLNMVAPAALAFLGKYSVDNNLNATGLASLLGSQEENIRNAIPAGLNLASIYDTPVQPAKSVTAAHGHSGAHPVDAHSKEVVYDERSGISKWIFPLFVLILLAVGSWYLYSKGGNGAAHSGGHTVATTTHAHTTVPSQTQAAAGSVDSITGNYVYNVGNKVSITLPGGVGKLEAGEFSTENKLYKFLSDKSAMLDTIKGNWFEFTNLKFKTGSAEITDESMSQLKNLVAISKAFPDAKFKVGGYTDNTGNATTNVSLSQKRADAVQAMLTKLGAASSAITGAEGYGPEHPVGDNATTEGRAMNRRVAVNVKAK